MTENSYAERFYAVFQRRNFTFEGCQASWFIELQWSRRILIATIYRFAVCLYTIGWFAADIAGNTDPRYWAYLTHWGEFVMVLYFTLSFIIVFISFLDEFLNNPVDRDKDRWYYRAVWGIFNIYATLALVITFSYWVGVGFNLLEPDKSASSVNVHVHVINSVLAVTEIMFSKLEIRVYHFYLPLAFGSVYLLIIGLYFASGDPVPIYRILDWANDPGRAVGFALGILLLAVPFYHCIIVWVFYRIRVIIFNRWAGESPPNPQSNTLDTRPNDITVL